MAPDRSKPSPIVSNPPPPRTLNVQKFAESRAAELQSLHSIVSERLNHDFQIRRSERRRTTGYQRSNNKSGRKRRRIGEEQAGSGTGTEKKDPIRVSRRIRRRLEFQKNPESGFVTSGDGTKRLRTHIWHAKRFAMVKRWGFYLPLGIQGRGRGSKALLKWLRSGVLVHDVSYCHPVQLEGPEDAILGILRMVILPSPSDDSEKISHPVHHGVCYRNAMLYNVGIPHSQLIAPVMYMWQPPGEREKIVDAEQDHVTNLHNNSNNSQCSTSYRQMWIWIHAAAFEEGVHALRIACQKQMDEIGVSVSCISREGQIAQLEILGSKALQILQKILHPVSMSCSTSDSSISSQSCTSSQPQKRFFLEHATHLPPHAILSLSVNDPRNLSSEETKPLRETITRFGRDSQEEDIQDSDALISGDSTENEDLLLSLWTKPEINGGFLSDSEPLWDASNKLDPPVPDKILSMERHHRRLKHFYLDSNHQETVPTEARDGFGDSCSILLLKHGIQESLNARWSIVLPLSWVKAFWISLVSHGAHAIGLRERRWIACDNGLPTFPYDFPDSKAYSLLMAAEAAASDKLADRRPLAVRPPRVPIPPPWDCVASTFKKGLRINGYFQTLDVDNDGALAPANSSVASETQHEASFQGFVPRTSGVLNEHLDGIRGGTVNSVPAVKELCLARLLIRAYKEGAFEEGAVVCWPALSDLSWWESRSEEERKLQMPPSLVSSYFAQQDSGKWELQLPEDCSTSEGYRWPIGFVTTGFIRGSRKPVAVALCEAKLLSQLKEQQAHHVTEKEKERPELCVLVRNLRSSAYRRALATVVVEQEEEDVDFM